MHNYTRFVHVRIIVKPHLPLQANAVNYKLTFSLLQGYIECKYCWRL